MNLHKIQACLYRPVTILYFYRGSGSFCLATKTGHKINETVAGSDQKENKHLRKKLQILTGIFFSGLCWYFSNGLTRYYWYLLWIAPIPILYISI